MNRTDKVKEMLKAGLDTKVAKKNANDLLNREYSDIRDTIDKAWDLDLPFYVHQWNEKYINKCADYPEQVAKIGELKDLYLTVKNTEIVPKKSKKQTEKERLEAIACDLTGIKEAFDKIRPEWIKDVLESVNHRHEILVNALVEGFININDNDAENKKYRNLFDEIRDCYDYERKSLSETDYRTRIYYTRNENKVQNYVERVVEERLAEIRLKIAGKAETLENVEIHYINGNNFEITISGVREGKKVEMIQQMIINWSKLGNAFYQFPCRMYVEGKSVSEIDYKKLFR